MINSRAVFSLLFQISHVAVYVHSFIKSYQISAELAIEIRCIFWVSDTISWMYVIFIVQSVKLPYLWIVDTPCPLIFAQSETTSTYKCNWFKRNNKFMKLSDYQTRSTSQSAFFTNSKWNCMWYVLHNSTYMYLKCLSFIYWTIKRMRKKEIALQICILNVFTWSEQVKCKVSSKRRFCSGFE